MNYIVHRRYKGKAMTGVEVNLSALTALDGDGEIVFINGFPLCYRTSQVAHEYLARNDDGNGMERGRICHEIAFSNRKKFNSDRTRQQRFTDKEIEMLTDRWSHYLVKDIDVILFNQEFFDADILSLREMAKNLMIQVR